MEKKHLILAVAVILILAVALGLLAPYFLNGGQPHGTDSAGETTEPSQSTTQPSGPAQESTTAPDPEESTPSTTVPADPSGTTTPEDPEGTTAPSGSSETTKPTNTVPPSTEPTHTHSFEKQETVAATMDAPGYTRYTCKDCGYSYQGDVTAALTLQQVINAQTLHPTATGIGELDTLVEGVLAQILPANATNYEKLDAIYRYILTECSHGNGEVDLGKAVKLAGNKVFRSAGDLLFSYEAYQMLTEKQGVSDHYAALFYVLTRGAGFDSYAVTGELNGRSHVWNNVRIDGKLYAFDTYTTTAPQFAVADGGLSGYSYQNRDKDMAAQCGFQAADTFTVKLTLIDDTGTTEKEFTWSMADMRGGTANFMKNTPNLIRAKGIVTYTLTVTGGSGSFLLTNELEEAVSGSSITGTLEPGGGYHTLQAEEVNSMMHFVFRIDN